MFRRFIALFLIAMLCCLPAHAASGLEITQVVENGDGTITIFWKDPAGNGPYTISYREKFESDFNSIAQVDGKPRTILLSNSNVDAVPTGSGYFFTTRNFLHGTTQWIAVKDSQGNRVHIQYTTQPARPSTQHSSVTLQPMQQAADGARSEIDAFTLGDLSRNPAGYGVTARITFDDVTADTPVNLQCVMTTPAGQSFVLSQATYTLPKDHDVLTWTFIRLEGAVTILERTQGILEGDYTLTFYFNGEDMGSSTFQIVDAAPAPAPYQSLPR